MLYWLRSSDAISSRICSTWFPRPSVQVPESSEERLLQDLLGILPAAGEAQGEPVRLPLVALDELTERRPVPAAYPLDQFAHGFTSTLFLPHPTDRVGILYPPSKPTPPKAAARKPL